jgi:murein DD-endopeptidase MepM/ murein hydrolase activator NlpD
MEVRLIAASLLVCCVAYAAEVRESRLGTAASESACAITQPATTVDASSAQMFVQFNVQRLRAGDRLSIQWVNPRGEISTTAAYDDLPSASALCFLSALPVGGFTPSTQPGSWQVRVLVNGRRVHERAFEIAGGAGGLSVRVASFDESQIVLESAGAGSDTSVNIARYTPAGGWEYVMHVLPETQDGNRITVKAPKLDAAEYLIILRNPDGAVSPPARFVVATRSGYQMPVLAAERWRISQRPYGSYSHFGRALHAYDIAPIDGRWVTAMRAGAVLAHDLGFGQTPNRRIFGNYITLRHDDGEFSHYAHLRTRTFRVRTGERVEAGQPLAEVGNSGYSFGRHVHVHVTRAASISAQSVPFEFSGAQRPAVSSHQKHEARPERRASRWTGQLGFAQWWSHLLTVPKGARSLEVKLGWENQETGFDLYLVSPSGRNYRDGGRLMRVDSPEAGQWRVAVQAVQGQGSALSFWVEPEIRAGQN